MHRARKFSHVFGQTSENNSKTILPSAKKKKIKIKIKYYVQYEKIISKNVCSYNPIEDQMLKKLISNKIGFIIKSVMN